MLLAEGIKPETVFVMRHANSASDAMRSTVGAAAGLSVADDGGGKPVFRNWKPYDAASAVAVPPPPMRKIESPATLVPFEPESVQEAVP